MTLIVAAAITVILVENLFASAMLFGSFSLLAAGLFVLLDAVDVAFTEAAVGAGISTILVLGTLALIKGDHRAPLRWSFWPALSVVATAALLVMGTLDMPAFGDPQAPIHQHVAPHYLNTSFDAIGIPNVVTSVLASYRGYDTLGEVTVIFTAGVGVLALIGHVRRREPSGEGSTGTGTGNNADDHSRNNSDSNSGSAEHA